VAEAQGVKDWKTLSAQGTLRAKQGKHAEAQQYYLAALQEQPDAVSVINNLALSYALDGKAGKSEELLRKAVASGHGDKRVRQNLALVLGLQGKFDEARKVAALDMSDQEAKSNMAYLRNMMSNSTQFAAATPDGADDTPGDNWQPFAANDAAASKSAAATQIATPKIAPVKAAQAAAPAAPAKREKVAGTPTLVTPVMTTQAQVKAAVPAGSAQTGPAGLLRTDTD
jgi:tetratricopeptide (TPR) repeat protein